MSCPAPTRSPSGDLGSCVETFLSTARGSDVCHGPRELERNLFCPEPLGSSALEHSQHLHNTEYIYICGNVKEYQNSKQYTYELTKKGMCVYLHIDTISYIYTYIYMYIYTVSKECSVVYVCRYMRHMDTTKGN